jgi:hypothetical protein
LFNNQKAFGDGLNFSQRLGGHAGFKKLSLDMNINYSITSNNDAGSLLRSSAFLPLGLGQISAPAFFRSKSLKMDLSGNLRLKKLSVSASTSYGNTKSDAAADSSLRNVSDLNMLLNTRLTIKKSYFLTANISKRINYGYALATPNPLLINATVSKAFLKTKNLHLNFSGNDLLGQGNNISRVLAGNTIIDTRNKQQTRVFTLGLTYDLSKFGGRVMRVDAD